MQASTSSRRSCIGLPLFCADRKPRRADFWRAPRIAVVSFITAFVCCFGSETSAACIDYGDYVRWVGGVDTRGDAIGVAVSDPYAYVAEGTSGLSVVDIANSHSPQIVGSADTPGAARDVVISGTHAYVADYASGLQVIPPLTMAG